MEWWRVSGWVTTMVDASRWSRHKSWRDCQRSYLMIILERLMWLNHPWIQERDRIRFLTCVDIQLVNELTLSYEKKIFGYKFCKKEQHTKFQG